MEIGLVFAVLTAVSFGLSDIFARRGVLRAGESYTAVLISLFIGILLFSLIITVRVQWDILWSIPGQALGLLMGAGIIHLVGGRFLFYSSVRLIGANKASAISRIEILIAVGLGIMLLNESLTTPLVLGVLCIAPGVILASREKKIAGGVEEGSETYRMQSKGVLLGLGAGMCWGLTGILIRPALQEVGSPFVGVLISYSTAFVIMVSFLFRKGQREKLAQLNRSALTPIAIAGILTSCANLFKYTAFSFSPVSLVIPVVSTTIIYVLLFSFLLNRKIEVFTPKVITGMLLGAAGTFILSL